MVAAGQSKRLKSKVPKPFLPLAGKKTMLDLCLASFKKVPGLAYAIIVTRKPFMERAIQSIYHQRLAGIVTKGGEQREDSVRRGLHVVPPGVEHVLIHDTARPLASPALIEKVLQATRRYGAVIPVVPVKDTLKLVAGDKVVKTLDRSRIWAVQTPQGFRFKDLKKAFRKVGSRVSRLTDDAAVAEAAGWKVRVVEGDVHNFKVTTPEDLKHAKELIRKGK